MSLGKNFTRKTSNAFREELTMEADAILSARWVIPILRVLAKNPNRFSGIKNLLKGVSPKVLALRLRQLEDASIIEKVRLPAPANCDGYALTELGLSTIPIIIAINDWAAKMTELTVEARTGCNFGR